MEGVLLYERSQTGREVPSVSLNTASILHLFSKCISPPVSPPLPPPPPATSSCADYEGAIASGSVIDNFYAGGTCQVFYGAKPTPITCLPTT